MCNGDTTYSIKSSGVEKNFKIMSKIKTVIKIIILLFVLYLLYFVYVTYWYSHDWEACKQYMWFFKNSIRNDIDPPGYSICFSLVKKSDVYNIFHYVHDRDMYPIHIWEFKDLGNADINKMNINQHIDFSDIRFRSKEILNSNSSVPVTIKYGFAFHNTMSINLDGLSKIDGTFSGPNYKGFYGSINKMSFSNEKGEHQIIFDYTDKPYKTSFSPTVFLLYKGHQSFYVIIINSKQPFKDASIISILNLQ